MILQSLEYIPKMLKGKGQIDVQNSFQTMVIHSLKRNLLPKKQVFLTGDELIGLDSIKFAYSDEFQKYLRENRKKALVLNMMRKGKIK